MILSASEPRGLPWVCEPHGPRAGSIKHGHQVQTQATRHRASRDCVRSPVGTVVDRVQHQTADPASAEAFLSVAGCLALLRIPVRPAGYDKYPYDFAKLIWQPASPKRRFDDATFACSAAAFDNPA